MRSFMMTRVMILALVASLFPLSALNAHEVFPAIVNLETGQDPGQDLGQQAGQQAGQGQVTLTFDLNLEAILAGVDLDQVTDTNEASNAGGYDALRALSPTALALRAKPALPEILGNITLLADGKPLTLHHGATSVSDPGDPGLVRETRLTLTAGLPPGAGTLQLGWARQYGTLIVRQNGVDDPYTGTLSPGAVSDPFRISGGSQITGWRAFGEYIPVGFDHIVPKGLDHILFVLGLFFLAARLRPLLWQVSAFTAAHTITLALAAMGWVSVPANIVEPLIAASICYVAVENILTDRLHAWRPLVVFGFGLLHGLGFASVLGDFGLPEAHFIPALLGFNAGVELGQLTVIAVAYLLVGAWFSDRPWYRARIAVPASAVIALVGAWWVFQRVFL